VDSILELSGAEKQSVMHSVSRADDLQNALAGVPFGGGKSIIIGDNKTANREAIFRAHGALLRHSMDVTIMPKMLDQALRYGVWSAARQGMLPGLANKSGDLRRSPPVGFSERFRLPQNIFGA